MKEAVQEVLKKNARLLLILSLYLHKILYLNNQGSLIKNLTHL